MAHYQNGHPAYYRQHASAQQQQDGQPLRRVPSFDAGDDGALLDGSRVVNTRARNGNSRYSLRSNTGDSSGGGGDDNLVSLYSQMAVANAVPSRSSSSHIVDQYQHVPMSPTQSSYNPQQYALSPAQSQQPVAYSSLGYSGSTGSSSRHHQSYNPAAYQSVSTLGYMSPGVQRPSSSAAASQYAYSPTTPQHSYSASSEQVYGFSQQPAIATPTALSAGSQTYPAYMPQSPMRTEYSIPSSIDEQPPEPPAHLAQSDDVYGKRFSGSRSGSGRSLPTPPVLQSSSPMRTDTLSRHPHARPLPGPPVETEDPFLPPLPRPTEERGYDDLMKEVEAAVSSGRPHSHSHSNGNIPTGTGQYVNYDAYSDDSDAEAAAGIAMMQMAEEEERAQAARRASSHSAIPPPYNDNNNSDEEGVVDLALYGGGYVGHLHYGDGTDLTRASDVGDSSFRSSNWSAGGGGGGGGQPTGSDEYDYPAMPWGSMHPFSEYLPDVRVDAAGTGGLSEPNPHGRRLSFDYGDEVDGLLPTPDPSRSDSESAEPGDLFFHPGMRPLPPAPMEPTNNTNVFPYLMPAGTYRSQDQGDKFAEYPHAFYPLSPDSFEQTAPSAPPVPRSTSLTSHPIGPRADPPIRSKTDADRAKYKSQQELLRQQGLDIQQPSPMALDLPAIPAGRRKKFNPAKLSSEQFKKCTEPWALSAILAWVRDLSEEETDLKEQAIVDAIVALFTHKVPTMNVADAETLAARVVMNMLEEQALVKEEEWVKFGSGTLSGVLFQITGTGCYSSRLHIQETEVFGRCYSHYCMRTLKKVNLKAQVLEPQKKAEDWVTFYKVPKELWESYPKKEIDRQYNLHEIVTTEDSYITQLDVLRQLYRDQLAKAHPPVMPPKRLDRFLKDVFGKVDAVKKVNEDFLLAQLKYRQKEQGPFIVGFSDIFREWIRKAKTVYIDYAATFPNANYLVRKEAERNLPFREFLNQVRDDKLSNRLGWDTYLKAPITRIQRYTLLLATVHKNMLKDSEEKTNLAQAIEEIKVVALDCDNKVGEMSKKVDLIELSHKLQLRPEMKKEVELNLEHLGREIIFRGDLQRPGTRTRFNLVDTHAILFDHYLVLAKMFTARDPSKTVKFPSYDVSKLPIPMDLLVLESTNDDPVVKSAVRGVAAVAPPQAAARAAAPNAHANAGNAGLVPSTSLENSKDDKILYPFKIKHLGKSPSYTLYAFSAQNRQDWCEKIIEAKTRHAAALFAQNAEPFRLRVLADTAFAYSEPQASKCVMITGTPIHRSIREVEKRYPDSSEPRSRPPSICRSAVNCATVFQQASGRMMCAVGTDFGVFMSSYDDPRGWFRAIPISRVTQIAVFEEFNLLLLIADKYLIAYHLDAVCSPNGGPPQSSQDSARRAPQKLSGARDVGFFAVGRMKDRTLVLYKKRDGLSSTFKVLEPVLQKSTSSRSRFFHSRRGHTEFFREYDEFYIPAESYSVNLFHTSLAISTHRGVEVLTLDKKQPWSVPMLRSETPEAQAYLTSISQRIKDLRPLGMFRLSDSEFLVTYSECAVYVNQHGDVSRSVVMEFVGKAQTACLYGKFLILFNDDFVEVRNAMNGRLRQVIPGRNVVCLDDGGNLPGSGSGSLASASASTSNGVSSSASSGRTVKFCMQHPQYEKCQVVLELIGNEVQKD